ncbi:MAG: hypothetical protein ACKVPX_13870 [Myxococcaceae bacterium]
MATETSHQLDASLYDTRDSRVRISQFRGKPVVLIYEDRGSVELNREFKNALRHNGELPGASNDVAIIAVANVSAFNFFPVRGFALNSVRHVEEKAKHPILCDWEEALARPPWNLPKASSTVVVLNPAGEVVFQQSGKMTPEQREAAFATLRKHLPPSDGDAASKREHP